MKCSNCNGDIGIEDEDDMPTNFYCPNCGALLKIGLITMGKSKGYIGVVTVWTDDD
jgi:transcription initiation factor TFIIIB Brf1 subunit/transcription initiation factor TFIIB